MAEQVYAAVSKAASERSEGSIPSRPTFIKRAEKNVWSLAEYSFTHLKCLWLHAGPPNRNRGVQLSLGARF